MLSQSVSNFQIQSVICSMLWKCWLVALEATRAVSSQHIQKGTLNLSNLVSRAPKTRTQQGFPFIGYKYPWLLKGHRGIVESSVQQHGIWKTCAQLTDWQQPSKITTAPSWREHRVIPASHMWENKNIIGWDLLLPKHRGCSFWGGGGMKEGHKTYIWLRRKLRVTLKILWGYTKCLSSVPANYLRDTFFILAIFKLLGGFLVGKVCLLHAIRTLRQRNTFSPEVRLKFLLNTTLNNNNHHVFLR